MRHAWRLREYDSLPSTSDLCVALAQGGEPGGLAVLAGRQTAARGSRGRTWETLAGNLALSVLLRPNDPAVAAGQYALLAAVALAEALERSGAPAVTVKWPNDVMLGGRKLGGILLDTGLEADRLAWLVIGLGANLAAAPDLPTATKLPSPIPPLTVANALLAHLDHWLDLLQSDRAEAIHAAWLARGPALGAPLRLALGPDTVAGTFAGLSGTGALRLQSDGQVRAFATGDVLQGA